MIVVFWIVAGITALAFFAAGVFKLVRPKAALATSGLGWVEDFSAPVVKLIGLAELVGALGIVLPPLTRLATVLSPIAALCLVVIMIGAVVTHVRRKETFIPPLVLMLLALATAVLGFIALI